MIAMLTTLALWALFFALVSAADYLRTPPDYLEFDHYGREARREWDHTGEPGE